MTEQNHRNRINLTLDDDLYATISQISELSGQPKASLINDLLTDMKPHLDMTIQFHRNIKENKMKLSDARQILLQALHDAGDVIHNAQGQLNIAYKEINKETDEESDNATNSRKSD